jgi:lysophospholipase L1-like esterase
VSLKSRVCLAGATLALSAACGGSPTGPPPPPVQNITLTCPSDLRIDNVTPPSVAVSYAPPVATGGVPPIAVVCAPASDAVFVLGTTLVTCNGTDGVRTGTCSFSVTLVAPVPMLQVTRFLAFGDSITAGENGEDPVPSVIDLGNSYPSILGQLLADRYTKQSPVVINAGVPQEHVLDGADRIGGVLDQVRPDALMLLEGVNDLTGKLSEDVPRIITGLTRDIAAARARGLAAVFVSTLIPQNPSGSRAHDVDEIEPVNAAIRNMAVQQGAILVDSFAAFAGHPEYLDSDGLHPRPAGNQAIAQQFFLAIQTRFEVALPPQANARSPLKWPGGIR